MSQKLNTPKGTRDFSSLELKKREYLLNVLKDCFKSFNFQEIQTPSFENLTTLIGKYGDDEDNLMFKILSSGDKIKKADIDAFKNKVSGIVIGRSLTKGNIKNNTKRLLDHLNK